MIFWAQIVNRPRKRCLITTLHQDGTCSNSHVSTLLHLIWGVGTEPAPPSFPLPPSVGFGGWGHLSSLSLLPQALILIQGFSCYCLRCIRLPVYSMRIMVLPLSALKFQRRTSVTSTVRKWLRKDKESELNHHFPDNVFKKTREEAKKEEGIWSRKRKLQSRPKSLGSRRAMSPEKVQQNWNPGARSPAE